MIVLIGLLVGGGLGFVLMTRLGESLGEFLGEALGEGLGDEASPLPSHNCALVSDDLEDFESVEPVNSNYINTSITSLHNNKQGSLKLIIRQ